VKKPLFVVSGIETVFSNRWITLTREAFTRFDGLTNNYAVVKRRAGVVVAAVDKDLQVVLIRKPVYTMDGYSLELPGGGVDEGEDAMTAAKRELEEETGATASNWKCVGRSWPHTDSERHFADIFMAENAEWADDHVDDGEEAAERLRLPLREAVEKCLQGEIVHSHSVIGILAAARILGV
jgi:8-oxo-dGTP pyrophosphatase MutT (NUDIX family)